jgi:hypothetical protein
LSKIASAAARLASYEAALLPGLPFDVSTIRCKRNSPPSVPKGRWKLAGRWSAREAARNPRTDRRGMFCAPAGAREATPGVMHLESGSTLPQRIASIRVLRMRLFISLLAVTLLNLGSVTPCQLCWAEAVHSAEHASCAHDHESDLHDHDLASCDCNHSHTCQVYSDAAPLRTSHTATPCIEETVQPLLPIASTYEPSPPLAVPRQTPLIHTTTVLLC